MNNPLEFNCRIGFNKITYEPRLKFNFVIPTINIYNDSHEMTKEQIIEKWSIIVQTEFAECLANHMMVPIP